MSGATLVGGAMVLAGVAAAVDSFAQGRAIDAVLIASLVAVLTAAIAMHAAL